MNWKMSLLTAFLGSILVFPLLTGRHERASQDHIMDAMESIAISFFFVGNGELKRGGHRRVLRVLGGCLIVWFAINLILFGIVALSKTNVLDTVFRYADYSLWLVFAAPFPFALYLNRNQSKSTSHPTGANAS
jgi:hypothetical protein